MIGFISNRLLLEMNIRKYHFDPPPTILAYLEKAEYTFWHPHDGRIAAQLSRIVYLKQVHHLGCPSARKCGILCFSA